MRAVLACNRHLACSKAVSSSGVSRLDQIDSSLVCCCSSALVLVVYTDIDSYDLLSRLLASRPAKRRDEIIGFTYSVGRKMIQIC